MAMLKARDVEQHFKQKGVERGALYVCTVLAEQQTAIRQDMRELGSTVDQMANILQSLVAVGENMKSAVETMNGNAQREEDLGFSTLRPDENDD